VASGVKTERAQLRRVLDQIAAGDVVTYPRLHAFFKFGDAWADTTTAHGRLMLTVIGGLAEFERELIRARTSEGSARAVARGVKMGRRLPWRPSVFWRPAF
jgi:DNA invertase Pin-like site-specific DNA recombinase